MSHYLGKEHSIIAGHAGTIAKMDVVDHLDEKYLQATRI